MTQYGGSPPGLLDCALAAPTWCGAWRVWRRSIWVWLVAVSVLAWVPEADAATKRKSTAVRKAGATRKSKARATPRAPVPQPARAPVAAPVTPPTAPVAAPVPLPASATPTASTATPVSTAKQAMPAPTPAAKPPAPAKANAASKVPAPAKASVAPAPLPGAVTATTAAAAATAVVAAQAAKHPSVAFAQAAADAKVAAAQPPATHAASHKPAPAAATPVALPVAATPVALPGSATSTAPGTPRKLAEPVETARSLPAVPPEKLQSDAYSASIGVLAGQGKYGEALLEVDNLLARHPNDDELKARRARLLFWLDRRQAARDVLDDLRTRRPADPELRELHAQLLLADGDLDGALREYRLLELAGDGRPELHQRVLNLALELDDHEAVTAGLKSGGTLTDEQAMKYVKLAHPWFADAAFTGTVHTGTFWPRVDAHLGKNLNKNWTLLAGGIWEQRQTADGIDRAWAPKAELYGHVGIIDGMLHVEGSPTRTFLPVFDTRLDLSASIVKWFSVGLYGRFAYYNPTLDREELPTKVWTLAPNVTAYLQQWALQAGYMLLDVPNTPQTSDFFHTGFLKARWEPTPMWTAFAWLYLGTDPTFVERYGVKNAAGGTLVLGGEHWWTTRFGTRVYASRTQPFDTHNDPYTDFTIVLRGRL